MSEPRRPAAMWSSPATRSSRSTADGQRNCWFTLAMHQRHAGVLPLITISTLLQESFPVSALTGGASPRCWRGLRMGGDRPAFDEWRQMVGPKQQTCAWTSSGLTRPTRCESQPSRQRSQIPPVSPRTVAAIESHRVIVANLRMHRDDVVCSISAATQPWRYCSAAQTRASSIADPGLPERTRRATAARATVASQKCCK